MTFSLTKLNTTALISTLAVLICFCTSTNMSEKSSSIVNEVHINFTESDSDILKDIKEEALISLEPTVDCKETDCLKYSLENLSTLVSSSARDVIYAYFDKKQNPNLFNALEYTGNEFEYFRFLKESKEIRNKKFLLLTIQIRSLENLLNVSDYDFKESVFKPVIVEEPQHQFNWFVQREPFKIRVPVEEGEEFRRSIIENRSELTNLFLKPRLKVQLLFKINGTEQDKQAWECADGSIYWKKPPAIEICKPSKRIRKFIVLSPIRYFIQDTRSTSRIYKNF